MLFFIIILTKTRPRDAENTFERSLTGQVIFTFCITRATHFILSWVKFHICFVPAEINIAARLKR